MNTELTIRLRSVVLALCVLVGLLLAYLLGTAGRATPALTAAPPAPEEPEQTRSIVMSGAGEAEGVPDQLSFKLSVRTTAADVSAALDQANARMRRVQAALREAGVARRDMQTAGLDIRADYDYPESGPPVITGYTVSEDLGVLVRALRDSGAAISAAVETGGNTVRMHGLTLRIGDPDALMLRARDDAVAEATAKAEQYAEATGQRLGAVVSVKEVSASRPRPVPVYAGRAAMDEGLSKVPVRAGSSELKVTVRVEWSFA